MPRSFIPAEMAGKVSLLQQKVLLSLRMLKFEEEEFQDQEIKQVDVCQQLCYNQLFVFQTLSHSFTPSN